MRTGDIIAILTTYAAISIVGLGLTLRVTGHLWRSSKIYADVYVGAPGGPADPELALGATAPEFPADRLNGERIVLSSLWSGTGQLLLFVSPGCEHCLILSTKLAKLDQSIWQSISLISDSLAQRTENFLQPVLELNARVRDRVLCVPHISSRLQFTYNPRGQYPYFCVVDAAGRVSARGPAVAANEEWNRHFEFLHTASRTGRSESSQ